MQRFVWPCAMMALLLTLQAQSAFGAEQAPSQPPADVHQLTAAELDSLVQAGLGDSAPSDDPLIDDAQFLRRVTLDLIGRQPTVSELRELSKARQQGVPIEERRAAVVDRLLASEDYGANWADYWSDTISYRVPPPELTFLTYTPLKGWLAQRLNANDPWSDIAADLLTASGVVKDNPAATFVGYHQGDANKLAAETARIFLGVQLQCAECHDHPYESWKREQFHELAAFFARAKGDLGKVQDGTGTKVSDRGKGEHLMPNADDPQQPGTTMAPIFLTGSGIETKTTDEQRRRELARNIASPENPWFAKAYVNRVWARMLGAGFYEPVDDMGEHVPQRLPEVHAALTAHLIGSGFDMKGLLRLIATSHAYQRPLATEEVRTYAAGRPTRLRGDQVFASLVTAIALPNVRGKQMEPTPEVRFPPPPKSTRDLVVDAFGFDPSLAPKEVQRSMAQAMWMMNNEQLQAQIDANPKSKTMLSRLLAGTKDNGKAVDALFMSVLARGPSKQEREIALEHVASINERGAAFEDLLWSLLNTAEFTTRR